MFELLTNDKEFADHNKDDHATAGSRTGCPSAWSPPAQLQPLWSQPDAKPPRFEDGLDRAKSRFSGILSDLSLNDPKELTQ